MACAVGLLLESELELLLELLLALREFVATEPSGVCPSTRSANLTFFLAGSGTESRSPVLASSSAVSTTRSCAICTLIEVNISGHVPDNPGTAFLAVIRGFQSQSRMLAPDTSVRVPVPRQVH